MWGLVWRRDQPCQLTLCSFDAAVRQARGSRACKNCAVLISSHRCCIEKYWSGHCVSRTPVVPPSPYTHAMHVIVPHIICEQNRAWLRVAL